MRLRNLPVIRDIANGRVRRDMWREEIPEEIQAAQADIDACWAEYEQGEERGVPAEPDEQGRYYSTVTWPDPGEAAEYRAAMTELDRAERDPANAEAAEAAELRADQYVSNEVNDAYMQRADAVEWGEEGPGNPPDCMIRDMEIAHYSEKYPEHQGIPAQVQRGPNGEWAFEDWAEVHGYGRDDINFVSDVEERRANVRAGHEILDPHDSAFPQGRYEEVGRALRQIEEHRLEREPANLERGQLHGPVNH